MIEQEIEGVVKYSVKHTKTTSETFDNYEKLEALRARLYALGLVGESNGIGYGNISSREDDNSFYITATQTGSKSRLTEKYYTKITDYSFSDFSVTSQGEHSPSSEALSHAMIYDLSSKITTVIHIHSLALWKFMIAKNALSTTAEYGTAEMTKEIEALYELNDPLANNAFVMKGHREGVMVFGQSLEEAELVLYGLLGELLSS